MKHILITGNHLSWPEPPDRLIGVPWRPEYDGELPEVGEHLELEHAELGGCQEFVVAEVVIREDKLPLLRMHSAAAAVMD